MFSPRSSCNAPRPILVANDVAVPASTSDHQETTLDFLFPVNTFSFTSELLTYGIANARHNLDNFYSSAQENLNRQHYGEDVWTPLAQNDAQWKDKQQRQSQPMQNAQPEPADKPRPPESAQPEQQTDEEKLHPLVADASGFSEKHAGKSGNQDRFFVDREHGAFGVFDGVGSYKNSGEVADTAKTYISEALAQIDPQLPLDETEKRVRQALVTALDFSRPLVRRRIDNTKTFNEIRVFLNIFEIVCINNAAGKKFNISFTIALYKSTVYFICSDFIEVLAFENVFQKSLFCSFSSVFGISFQKTIDVYSPFLHTLRFRGALPKFIAFIERGTSETLAMIVWDAVCSASQ